MAKIVDIKFKNLNEINFNSLELKKEYDEIIEKNKRLIESTKPDWSTMHRTFDF